MTPRPAKAKSRPRKPAHQRSGYRPMGRNPRQHRSQGSEAVQPRPNQPEEQQPQRPLGRMKSRLAAMFGLGAKGYAPTGAGRNASKTKKASSTEDAGEPRTKFKSNFSAWFIVICLLVMMNWLPTEAKTIVREVGTMYTPAAFAHIHLAVDTGNMGQQVEVLKYNLKALYRDAQAKNAPKGVLSSINRDIKATQAAIGLLKAEWAAIDSLVSFKMEKKAVKPPHVVEKRQVSAFLSVLALGIGVADHIEVKKLAETTKTMLHNQNVLIESLKTSINDINEVIQLASDVMDHERWVRLTHEAHAERVRVLMYVASKTQSLQRGLYNAIYGKLDPVLVPMSTLVTALEKLREKSELLGMRLAGEEVSIETLFTMPITSAITEDGLQLWISVPIVPAASPRLKIKQLTHVAVPVGEHVVEMGDPDRYLAVDDAHEFYIEITSGELSACAQFKSNFFCQQSTLVNSFESCGFALLRGDKATAMATCSKFISKAPVLFIPEASKVVDNETEAKKLDIYTGDPITVRVLCDNGQVKPNIRVVSRASVLVGKGCHLKTDKSVTYIPYEPREIHVAALGGEAWNMEELLDNVEETELVHLLDVLNATRVGKTSLANLKTVQVSEVWSGTDIIAVVAGVAATILFAEGCLRYCLLFTLKKGGSRKPPAEDKEEEIGLAEIAQVAGVAASLAA